MKVSYPRICAVRLGGVGFALVAALLWAPGCQQVFIQKHRVLVDAIAAPTATKPAGQSYRLVAKRAMVSNTPVQLPILKACVDAALQGQGLYEPPSTTPPDLVIEVSCGRDASSRALASVRETYLQLSARSNPQRALDKGTGPEIWDVRVAVLGLSGSIETALPLLSTVAAEHMATNTGLETRIEVPKNSPSVEAVRTAAIRTLESHAQLVAAANTGQSVSAASNGTAPRETGRSALPAPQVTLPAAAQNPVPETPVETGALPRGNANPNPLRENVEIAPESTPAEGPGSSKARTVAPPPAPSADEK